MPERPVRQEQSALKLKQHCRSEQDINILLLGSTGSGKSTIINYLTNYFSNDTLEQAVRDQMRITIPSTISYTDYETSDDRSIVLGEEDEYEKFSDNGESSTRQCRSFVFPIGHRNLCLIDTPGIGDTRGLEQDAKNYQEILNYIAQYEHLNGVCIVLKTNEERLSIPFRFYIDELLRHLHVNVKDNLIFVFTNARSTYFQPGSSLSLLRCLLNKYRENHDIVIPFSKDNVFLFDNEPFRYLALCKNGIRIDNEQTKGYTTSWNHSVNEYSRLMEHIATRPLHATRYALSLNEAQQLVRKLSRPIAETARFIEENIQLAKDHKNKVLENPRTASAGIPQNSAVIITLEYPRTICTGERCCRVSGDGNEKKVEYLLICHDKCYLAGVQQETLADPKLAECEAIDRHKGTCNICSCHWLQHKHITYEYKINRIHINSINTEYAGVNEGKCLKDIDKRISDLLVEAAKIKDSFKKLARFLHANAILSINDGYIDYLDSVIREEHMKLAAGAYNNEVISELIKLKTEFTTDMELFRKELEEQRGSENMRDGIHPHDIFRLVSTLYDLPITGEQIRQQVEQIKTSEEKSIIERENYVELPQKAASSKLMVQSMQLFSKDSSPYPLPVMFSDNEISIPLPVDLDLNIIQLVKCKTEQDLNAAISQLDSRCAFFVASKKLLSDKFLSNTQLLRYYLLIPPDRLAEMNSKHHAKLTCVISITYLCNGLWNDLGQYYHNTADRILNKQDDHVKAKDLLAKSTKCQEILMMETEKKLKRYADILKEQSLNDQKPVGNKPQ